MKCRNIKNCKDYRKGNVICENQGIYRIDTFTGRIIECDKINNKDKMIKRHKIMKRIIKIIMNILSIPFYLFRFSMISGEKLRIWCDK